MTYDEHYPGGTPGSVASIGWVTNVLNYAMTVAAAYGAVIKWDDVSKSKYFTYIDAQVYITKFGLKMQIQLDTNVIL
jgi:spore germination protein YaaH